MFLKYFVTIKAEHSLSKRILGNLFPISHDMKLQNSPGKNAFTKDEKKELPWWLSSKESTCEAGDVGSLPRSGQSTREGNGNPLQHSCLGNPMDRGAWRATVRGLAKVTHYLATNRSSKATIKMRVKEDNQ